MATQLKTFSTSFVIRTEHAMFLVWLKITLDTHSKVACQIIVD